MSKPAKLLLHSIVGLLLLSVALAPTQPTSSPSGKAGPTRRAAPSMPLHFEPNVGQFDPAILYLARGNGYVVALTEQRAKLIPQTMHSTATSDALSGAVSFVPVGANPSAKLVAESKFGGITNYFTSADPHNWRTRIPNYARVVYKDVYPGIDLAYHGTSSLEYDFVIAPHADASVIKLKIEGAEDLALNDGALTIRTKSGTFRQLPPTIYQQGSDGQRLVAGSYKLEDGEVSFALTSYNPEQSLVIDPVVVYSTYFGGNSSDYVTSVAADYSGNTYLTGLTDGQGIPSNHALFTLGGGFVSKLNSAGTDFIYSTYIPAQTSNYNGGIVVDNSGNAYVTGSAGGKDFPVVNAAQPKPGGFGDCFIMKLSADGASILYSTYLGASALDYGNAIAVDDQGHAYVTGFTASGGQPAWDEDYGRKEPLNFPTKNAVQPHHGGGYNDAFVTELSADGSSFIFSTYLGGSGNDAGTDIAVDSQHNIYVMGNTDSTNFPLRNPLYKQPRGYFLTKLAPAGASILYSTYVGGEVGQTVERFALDSADNIYLVGTLPAAGYPTPGPAVYTEYVGIPYVTEIIANGSRISATSTMGNQRVVLAHDIQADKAGNVYLVAFDPTNTKAVTATPQTDTVVMTRAPLTANTAVYTLHLDQRFKGYVVRFALDNYGNMYIGGETTSQQLPLKNAIQPHYGGGSSDGYALKLEGVIPTNAEANMPLMPATGAEDHWSLIAMFGLVLIALGASFWRRSARQRRR